jgi:hypothetical protein
MSRLTSSENPGEISLKFHVDPCTCTRIIVSDSELERQSEKGFGRENPQPNFYFSSLKRAAAKRNLDREITADLKCREHHQEIKIYISFCGQDFLTEFRPAISQGNL